MSVNIECLLMSTLKLLHEHLTRVCECESVCVYMCMCGRRLPQAQFVHFFESVLVIPSA